MLQQPSPDSARMSIFGVNEAVQFQERLVDLVDPPQDGNQQPVGVAVEVSEESLDKVHDRFDYSQVLHHHVEESSGNLLHTLRCCTSPAVDIRELVSNLGERNTRRFIQDIQAARKPGDDIGVAPWGSAIGRGTGWFLVPTRPETGIFQGETKAGAVRVDTHVRRHRDEGSIEQHHPVAVEGEIGAVGEPKNFGFVVTARHEICNIVELDLVGRGNERYAGIDRRRAGKNGSRCYGHWPGRGWSSQDSC